MIIRTNQWQKLFLFCLGLFVGSAFCMKWMESDFVLNGQSFTMIELEITYSKEKLSTTLASLDGPLKSILRYHLAFDFAFMAGAYPGIASLCMIAAGKSKNTTLRSILFALASLQTVAFACDIFENIYLFNWIKNPVIGNEFTTYHVLVITKWAIALTGALFAIPLALKRGNKNTNAA